MSSLSGKCVIRRSFGKRKDVVPVPDLIGIQSRSFNEFVQLDMLPEERVSLGLQKVFRDIFPVDFEDKLSLGFVSYELGHWSCTCGKLAGINNRYTWNCSSCKKTGHSRLDAQCTCTYCNKKTASYITCSNCLSRVSLQLPLTLEECRSSGQTFAMPLKVKIQLINWDIDDKGTKTVRDIKEQVIYFADLPVMADLYEENNVFKLGSTGTFLINGVDRVVVSQLHRSPGVVFGQSKKIKDVRGRPYYLARIIPMRGSWLDFEFDSNDLLYVRIDKKKKMLVTTFLQALGIPRDKIISQFYNTQNISVQKGGYFLPVDKAVLGLRIEKDMLPEDAAQTLVGSRITDSVLAKLEKEKITRLELNKSNLVGRVLANDVIDPQTGEMLAAQGQVFGQEQFEAFSKAHGLSFELIASSGYVIQPSIALTLTHDKCHSFDDAIKELHAKIWPGDNASQQEVRERLENMLFNSRMYDMTRVGRIRMNRKLNLTIDEDVSVLTLEDIIASIRYLVNLRELGEGELDDIDHLGNRRVRLVGELLTNQVYIGLSRVERIIRERFRMQEPQTALMPQDFLNVKPLSAALREFFGSGQLSQFIDQTNPLSEVAHKRRLSALGPGGVMKDRATFEIRDVHISHYGRICPIETPEGQTVGLISSLSTYAMVNDLGFIETAYRPVIDGKVKDEVVFMDAFAEADQYITQTDAFKSTSDVIQNDRVVARHGGNFMYVDSAKVNYVDLSSQQLVSVSTALIPFLEHDDASRALMGSNMQRQAVPLIKCQAPLVGTGMEREICKSSGAAIEAKRPGIVQYVSSEKIVVQADRDAFETVEDWIAHGIDIYYLKKFKRSSYSTWIHQSPVVARGEHVQAGDLLTDGPAIDSGDLALGSNLVVAFMPWHGYNYEDAIVLSKRLVTDDVLTSVHIDEYVVDARDTKLGPEEITKDIPNVSEKALSHLDDDGIVRIGTRVQPGDILVGKVTLKGDIQFSPEEKLLRAIFGEKSREVRDTSLYVPPGIEGTVLDVKVFSRSGIRKDKRYKEMVRVEVLKLEAEYAAHQGFLERMLAQQMVGLLDGAQSAGRPAAKVVADDKSYIKSVLETLDFEQISALKAKDKKIQDQIDLMTNTLQNQIRIMEGLKEERINRLKKGDPLPSGVIKMVKVYISSKRHISVGDKVAGRHGNKGVVSIIVPREDMPYMDNGTPADIVLNPLGVHSRMNVGQIIETALGWVGHEMGERLEAAIKEQGAKSVRKYLEDYFGKELVADYVKAHGADSLVELARSTAKTGVHFESPVFDGASFDGDVQPLLKSLDLSPADSFMIRDGRTGEYFDQPVTVGSLYVLKLNHMVDDKLHARSVGPYSLVTQQPLGGKAQMGGQRFGEMEMWALEAYGAAYTLQEMLTYKSDDVNGRHKVYEAIVRGDEVPEPGLPESFNVLVKELQSLGLQIDLFKGGKEEVGE